MCTWNPPDLKKAIPQGLWVACWNFQRLNAWVFTTICMGRRRDHLRYGLFQRAKRGQNCLRKLGTKVRTGTMVLRLWIKENFRSAFYFIFPSGFSILSFFLSLFLPSFYSLHLSCPSSSSSSYFSVHSSSITSLSSFLSLSFASYTRKKRPICNKPAGDL